ncbi:hypothetical protein MUK42_11592 [Musa troglodytarum]|uniref:Uncharacterized protein n=1 Tax=Musa troglodytarum TaxID=320322 RepID=A0A9E7HV25_9LILI|nr:hypothetical protein MUK42_11592 [Musa troglodytarum]
MASADLGVTFSSCAKSPVKRKSVTPEREEYLVGVSIGQCPLPLDDCLHLAPHPCFQSLSCEYAIVPFFMAFCFSLQDTHTRSQQTLLLNYLLMVRKQPEVSSLPQECVNFAVHVIERKMRSDLSVSNSLSIAPKHGRNGGSSLHRSEVTGGLKNGSSLRLGVMSIREPAATPYLPLAPRQHPDAAHPADGQGEVAVEVVEVGSVLAGDAHAILGCDELLIYPQHGLVVEHPGVVGALEGEVAAGVWV